MSGDACIFCRIVEGDAPAAHVYEDEQTLAFMDIAPLSRGHLLVIPREHAENLYEISADSLAAVARTSHRIAPVLRRVLEPEGLRILQLNGAAAGQTVFHYHMHLLPKNADEPDIGSAALRDRRMADPGELETLAAQLRDALS